MDIPKTLTMKSWICRSYGGPEVLALEDRPRPRPKDNEVLIRIRATTVSSGDIRLRSMTMPHGFGLIGRLALGITRLRQPILGSGLAGTVEAVGSQVTGFKVGDDVIAFPGAALRCHAEYRVVAVNKAIAPKPANLSFGDAASLLFGGMTALYFLQKAALKAGETILVVGASGAVGSAMVQLARYIGATVTGVTSTGNLDLVRSLGAAAVIDYAKEDFTTPGKTYDIIADTVGSSPFAKCHPLLNEHGRHLAVSGNLLALFARPKGTKRSIGGQAPERPKDILELAKLAEGGHLKPVVDRTFRFADIPAAHAYVGTGHKRGSVVVTADDRDGTMLS